MKLYKQILLVTSILTTLIIWYLFFQQEYFTEWKKYQREYRNILIEKAQTVDAAERAEQYPIMVRQVFLEDPDQIDRCVSCHTGIDNPQMVNELHPFKAHPGDYLINHPVDKYGCVVCHGGQGRALNKREAHAHVESRAFWEQPLLPKEHIQSSCGVCHNPEKTEQQAPHLARGKRLVRTLGCRGCHVINDIGGSIGPSLNEQGTYSAHHFPMEHLDGEHSSWNWMETHFLNPQLIVPVSKMKKLVKTERDSKDLTTFMLSLKGKQAYALHLTPKDRYKLIVDNFDFDQLTGEQLFNQTCAVCHGAAGDPNRGKLVKQYNQYFPILLSKDFASEVPKDYLIQTIHKGHPGTLMPGFESGLTPDMVGKIVSYIKSFGEETELLAYELKGDKDKGGTLYQKVCAECHGYYGEGAKGSNLRNQVFQQNVSDAFIAKTIKDGRPQTEMTALTTLEPESSEQEVADLVAYIRELPNIAIGATAGAAGWENYIDTKKYPGAVTFYQKCSSCHTIGEGDRKGPDLKEVLKRREEQWVYQQIVDPEGLVKSGDKVANDLAKQFGRVMENPNVPSKELMPLITFLYTPEEGKAMVAEAMTKAAAKSKGNVERGRQLFIGQLSFINNGSSCLPCHSLPSLGFLGGGSLGLDLMKSELSSAEIASALSTNTYQVMKELYSANPLDPVEINDIVAFIQEERGSQRKSPEGIWFVLLGIVGLGVWLFIIQAYWFKRLNNVRKDLVERNRK